MKHFLCPVIGSGIDAEANARRPFIADLTSRPWTVLAEGLGRMLVRTEHISAFDSIPGIQPLRLSHCRALSIPLKGEPDDWESPDLALVMVRRMLYRGVVPADPLLFRAQLDAIRARVTPRVMRKGGTFTDNFNGHTGTNILALNLHTPSGGTAWTVLDGTNTWAGVGGPNVSGATIEAVYSTTTDSLGVGYACDDQGNADQYCQGKMTGAAIASMICCNRMTNRSNYFAIRPSGSPVQITLWKRDAGNFTNLGTGTTTIVADAVVRLESEGNNHDVFVDGVPELGPVNDAFNNTATRQGLNARLTAGQRLIDDFEAGVLNPPVGGGLLPHLMSSGLFVGTNP